MAAIADEDIAEAEAFDDDMIEADMATAAAAAEAAAATRRRRQQQQPQRTLARQPN